MRDIITAEQTLKVITNHNALIKSVRTEAEDFSRWEYLLKQIQYPGTFRPVKSVYSEYSDIERNYIYNPRSDQYEKRELKSNVRGAAKYTIYTKKLSTSLLSPFANTTVFRHDTGENVGLVLNLNDCFIDPNYVYNQNINSDTKPWLKHGWCSSNGIDYKQLFKKAHSTIENLRADAHQAVQNKKQLGHNEILARLTKNAVIGVFCAEDNLIHRLGALAVKSRVFNSLNKDVPIFIIRENYVITEYESAHQREDLEQALQLPKSHPARAYAEQYFNKMNPEIRKEILQNASLNQQIKIPELTKDAIGYLGTFFNNPEISQLEFWKEQEIKNPKRSLPEMVNTMIENRINNNAKNQNHSFSNSKINIDSLKSIINTAIAYDEYYQRKKQKVNIAVEKFCRTQMIPVSEVAKIFINVLAKHKYLSPLARKFTTEGIHMYLPESLQTEFMYYLIRSANIENIRYLLESNLKFEERSINIIISKYTTSYVGEYSSTVKVPVAEPVQITTLTLAAIYNPQLCFRIHQKSPNLLLSSLKNIKEFTRLFAAAPEGNNFCWDMDFPNLKLNKFTIQQIQQAHIMLLKIVESENIPYIYSYQEKRLLENHYVSEIQQTHTKKELNQYHEKIKTAPSLQFRRHGFYDSIRSTFFGSKPTTIQNSIDQAVEQQDKLLQI